MSTSRDTRDPDLRFGGFSLWVFRRERPDSEDYWGGNWLYVKAEMSASGARVEFLGPYLHASELAGFAEELRVLNENITGSASLKCMEPNLEISIVGNHLGQVSSTVPITPDHMAQKHEFSFVVDQTYIRPLITACDAILKRFPIKGTAAK